MNIYFAYRTGYRANNRHVKIFQAESILDWFITHWQQLADDKQYQQLLGTKVYGYPLSIWREDEVIVPDVPNTFDELKDYLQDAVYCNALIGDEQCLQVATDDDEIELAWYVFTEEYKNAHPEKVAIWLNETLPLMTNQSLSLSIDLNQFVDEVQQTSVYEESEYDEDYHHVLNLGSDVTQSCYVVACTIYDSSNLEAIRAIQLAGVQLPDLLATLNKSAPIQADSYGLDVIKLLQKLTQNNPQANLQQVLQRFSQYSLSALYIDELERAKVGEVGDVQLGEHIASISICEYGEFYNYYVIFDDIWAGHYPHLAKSLLRFGLTWQI